MPIQQLRPWDTGMFDYTEGMKDYRANTLGDLQMRMEQIKAAKAVEQYTQQQALLAQMAPNKRAAFWFAPEQAGTALAKQEWPEPKVLGAGDSLFAGPKQIATNPAFSTVPLANQGGTAPPVQTPNGPVQTAPGPDPALAAGGNAQRFRPTTLQDMTVQSELGTAPIETMNPGGYVGKYQFGAAAAKDAGFYQPAPGEDLSKNQWRGRFTNLEGVNTLQDFRHSGEAQDLAWGHHERRLENEILRLGLDQFIGQTVGGVPITRESLIGMMHLGGPTGTMRFVRSGGKYDPADSNGTHISDYGKRFATAAPVELAGARPLATAMNEELAAGGGATPPPAPARSANVPAPAGVTAQTSQIPAASAASAASPAGSGSAGTAIGGARQPQYPPGAVSFRIDNKTGKYVQGGKEGMGVLVDANDRPVGVAPLPGSGAAGGPFAGTGADVQAWNTLLNATPDTREYALAFDHLTQAKPVMVNDPNDPTRTIQVMVKPSLPPSFPAPTYQGRPNVAGAPQTIPVPGTEKGGGPSAAERLALKKAESEVAQVMTALSDYRAALKATGGPGVTSAAGVPTKDATRLNTAWNNLALLLKGDTLYQLGVLNGHDLEIIRRTLLDPSTWTAVGANTLDPTTLTSQLDQIERVVKTGIAEKRRQLSSGGAARAAEEPAPLPEEPKPEPPPPPAAVPSRADIEAEMKRRGIL
jgi:hypothetical protein